MKRISLLLAMLFFISFGAIYDSQAQSLKGKGIVMIIASSKFRDEEFKIPYDLFRAEGAKVVIASSSLRESVGMLGLKVRPEKLLSQIDIDSFDALILVGGIGATEYWNNKTVHRLLKEAFNKGKVIGAICISPVTLANAGILKGKRATVWPTEASRLRAKGAIYTGKGVERDGDIITANGPQSASAFADEVIKALCHK